MEIGFLGVGQMGRPMVDRLVSAGFSVTAHARNPDVAAALRTTGVTVLSTPKAVANAVDILIVCLFSDEQSGEVLLGEEGALAGLKSGSVCVNHVTGSPDFAQHLADAAPKGVHYVDAPMSGSADQIRQGDLTLLIGAEDVALDKARSALLAYSDPILHCGAVGDGQRMKLINNLIFSVNLRLAGEAVALGERLGVPSTVLASAVAHCSGGSTALSYLARLPYAEFRNHSALYLAKDVALIRKVAAESQIELGLLGDLSEWAATTT
ncbi:NAD(P)-dependent oxidoreductase [Rhodococcus wratislaviensis]|uniref:NAD(P)-dependent oxidoreductase n=1 Tax=Rhodococcus wratislaviensis TaxID=44752 RepID=UPI0036670FD5